jgi:hypothetical protein
MADVASQPPFGSQRKSKVSVGDLPWALVMMPTTSSGQSGIGHNKHGLQPESWVIGFFADGDNCQQPIVVGTITGGPGKGSFGGQLTTSVYDAVVEPVVNAVTNTIENIAGNNNIEKGMNFLLKCGYTTEQAAGILGCLQVESGPGLNTKAFNSSGGGAGAFGIAQWRNPRQASLRAFADQYCHGQISNIEVQLAYLVKELKEMHQYSGAAEKLLQNAKSPIDAAIAFAHYERGEDYSALAYKETGNGATFDTKYPNNKTILKKRINNAVQIYQSFGNNKQTSTKAP